MSERSFGRPVAHLVRLTTLQDRPAWLLGSSDEKPVGKGLRGTRALVWISLKRHRSTVEWSGSSCLSKPTQNMICRCGTVTYRDFEACLACANTCAQMISDFPELNVFKYLRPCCWRKLPYAACFHSFETIGTFSMGGILRKSGTFTFTSSRNE